MCPGAALVLKLRAINLGLTDRLQVTVERCSSNPGRGRLPASRSYQRKCMRLEVISRVATMLKNKRSVIEIVAAPQLSSVKPGLGPYTARIIGTTQSLSIYAFGTRSFGLVGVKDRCHFGVGGAVRNTNIGSIDIPWSHFERGAHARQHRGFFAKTDIADVCSGSVLRTDYESVWRRARPWIVKGQLDPARYLARCGQPGGLLLR